MYAPLIPYFMINVAMLTPKYSVVLGDINGRLSEVFGKLKGLHAKQSFGFAIIAGNLLTDPETATEAENEAITKLIEGTIEVPLPTYFTLGRRNLPRAVIEKLESNDGELCPNLFVLGRKARVNTSDGFKIVAVSGVHREDDNDEPMSQYAATYTDKDATVAKGYNDADILVTSDWPADVRIGSKGEGSGKDGVGVTSIAELCSALKPRYHFSTSENFYEREPFFHSGEAPRQITRFLSLAPFGNTDKQKWIYAFSLEPSAGPPQNLPPGTTASPFIPIGPKKRKLDSQQDSFDSFRFSNGNGHHEQDSYRPKRRKGERGQPPDSSTCYFCLSNPTCETHMIGSIGESSYVTVAKGPLTTEKTFPNLGFPGHVLIIPLTHAPTIANIPAEDRDATEQEMQKYRGALHSMLATKSKGEDGRAQLGAVTWEISKAGGVHDHWQFLPVPVDMIQSGRVEAGFNALAEAHGVGKFAKTASEIVEAEEGDYFKVMVWSEGLRMDMVLPVEPGARFDLQFGRRVMAKLFGLEKRTHWKDCAQTTAEETNDAATFKQAFKDFDFSL